jgi:electron transport complex protein RnfB
MVMWISAVATLTLVSAVLGGLLIWARSRYEAEGSVLIDAVEDLLPHTQCAQCGYPGCRPYAQAVVEGAPLDLCPPGGTATFEALQNLLGRYEGTAPSDPTELIARITEAECIGCFLCVRSCPVDTILGSPGYMHTVIEAHCTGCELCVDACPVDCIEMLSTTETPPTAAASIQAPGFPCIACDLCTPVCPVSLSPQDLLWFTRADDWVAARTGNLALCIECGRCDAVCPSHIPLAATFGSGKLKLAHLDEVRGRAVEAKTRFTKRSERLIAHQAVDAENRTERLQRRGKTSW